MEELSLAPRRVKPPRILIFGPHKIGKSTFGSMADTPVFIQTEDGLTNIDVPAYPLARSFTDVMSYVGELATKPHGFRTAVVDSTDWLEPLIWKQVAQENGKKDIEAIGYGKGYTMALDLWREYLDALNYLRDERDMTIIQIAHAEIKRFENPETESYDRYQIKMHKLASDLIMEQADAILFANYFVGTTKSKQGFNNERVRAIGSGERILYTEEKPAFRAGNRYGLPSEIPFDKEGKFWNVLASHIPYYSNPAAQPAQQEKDA